MKLKIETQIKLDKFKPRSYQIPLFDAIENKGIKRAVLVWHRRCLSGDTYITKEDGSWKYLRDIEPGDKILSWNGTFFEIDEVVEKWSTGVKNTKRVDSPNLSVICSHDHIFAHNRFPSPYIKWDKITDIGVNRQLLQYAGIENGSLSQASLAECWGYMISQGYLEAEQSRNFKHFNEVILKRTEELICKLVVISLKIKKKKRSKSRFLQVTLKEEEIFNGIKALFERESSSFSKEIKRLPTYIWKFDKSSIILFFSALIAIDGTISMKELNPKRPEKRFAPSVEIAIHCGISDSYAWDIYWLLRKIGIVPQSPLYETGSHWKIRVTKQAYIKMLLSKSIYSQEETQKKALDIIKKFKKSRSSPNGCYRSIFKVQDDEPQELFDIEVKKNNNFIANGFLVHNCGKDVASFNLVIRQALKRVGSYYYILPTYRQARLVLFEGMLTTGQRFMDFIPKELIEKINIQEMKISLINGSLIYFLGSDNFDSLRGSNPSGIVFSEYAYQHPSTYPTLRPILVANDGWCVFISTPFGQNHFYKLYEVAKESPDWFCDIRTIVDTGVVSQESIEKEQQEGLMSLDMIEQEYYCSFNTGALGSYYAKYLNDMELNHQLGDVPWEPAFPVYTAWDLGVRDATVILFFQIIGKAIHIIDVYSNDSKGLEHYVAVVLEKKYKYLKHFAPHDIAVREFGSGMSRYDKAKELGVKFEMRANYNVLSSIVPNVSIMDGIESVRSTLPRIWIDRGKCKNLIAAIRDYRKEYDSRNKVYKSSPLHDNHSNYADALRYLCLSLRFCKKESGSEDLDKRYHEAVFGSNAHMPPFFRDNSGIY